MSVNIDPIVGEAVALRQVEEMQSGRTFELYPATAATGSMIGMTALNVEAPVIQHEVVTPLSKPQVRLLTELFDEDRVRQIGDLSVPERVNFAINIGHIYRDLKIRRATVEGKKGRSDQLVAFMEGKTYAEIALVSGVSGSSISIGLIGMAKTLAQKVPTEKLVEAITTQDTREYKEKIQNNDSAHIGNYATAKAITHTPRSDSAKMHDLRVRMAKRNETRLFDRLRQGDEAAKLALVESYKGLARHIAHGYSKTGELMEDLEQIANVGLLKALGRYDASREVAFSSYAVPTIRGEIQRHFRDRGWAVRPPRGLQEAALNFAKITGRFEEEQKKWTIEEVAQELGVSEAEALKAWLVHAHGARRAYSLNKVQSDDEGNERELIYTLDGSNGQDDPDAIVKKMAFMEALAELPLHQQKVILLRMQGWTQTEIGEYLGKSQMQASRYLKQAMGALTLKLSDASVSA